MTSKDVLFSRAACVATAAMLAAAAGLAHAEPVTVGAVYAMSNAAGNNTVIAYPRAADGTLGTGQTYATGGAGLGVALGSQGSLKLSEDGRWLFAVNAGSNEVTVFATDRLGLIATDRVSSGGIQPVSVAVHRNLIYVLNAGSDAITGFSIDLNGKLTPVPGSTHALDGSGTGAAQVEFSPDGAALVVTEKNTSEILVFPIGSDDLPGNPSVFPSATPVPFGFAFGRFGEFFVSEANPGQADLSTLASYRLLASGGARVQNPSAATYQSAACWVAVTGSGKYVYTANPTSNSITGFSVGPRGSLMLLSPNGVSASTGDGSAPLDMGMDRSSRYLYSLDSGSGSISAFGIGLNGTLSSVQTLSAGLPASGYGLAAQ